MRGYAMVWSRGAVAAACMVLCGAAGAGSFAPGNFVAYRVAPSGSGPLQIYVDEYQPDGTWVQAVALPTANAAGVKAFMAGTKGSEGLLNRSADRSCLALPGYAVEASYSKAALDGEAASNAPRAVAFMAADGGISGVAGLGSSAIDKGAIRSAATQDCSAAWASGDEGTSSQGGTWYGTRGGTSGTQIYKSKAQGLTMAAGQLYAYADKTLNYFDGAPPTAAVKPKALAFDKAPGNLRGIAFLDLDGDGVLDTLYGADNGGDQLVKYSWSAAQSKWLAAGTLALSGIHGLVAVDTGDGNVMLLVTTEKSSQVQRLFDRSGQGQALAGAFETLVSAPQVSGNLFYGLALAPEAKPPAQRPQPPASLSVIPGGNSVSASWAVTAGAAYYVVEVSVGKDFTTGVGQTAVVAANQATLSNLDVGKHQLRVRAVNSMGGSASTTPQPFTAAAAPTTGLPPLSAYSGVVDDPYDALASQGLSFTVGDALGAGAVQISATSSNQAVVPDANLQAGNNDGAATLRIAPAGVGYADITVTLGNAAGATATRTIKYAASANVGKSDGTRWYAGRSDGSTVVLRDGGSTMLVGDDEGLKDPDLSGNAGMAPDGNALFGWATGQSGLPLAPLLVDSGLGINSGSCPAGATGLVSCKADGEVDIEASFALGERIYLSGSHSNSKSGNSRADRWRFFAADASGAGKDTQLQVQGYYQWLREDLRSWDSANQHGLGADYFGLVASSSGGANQEPESATLAGFSIEGMSTSPDDSAAWFGFRAPMVTAPGGPAVTPADASGRTHALIVTVSNYKDLAIAANGGTKGTAVFGAPIRLDLQGRAIREIRKNAAGEYLIIAGSSAGAGLSFQLYSWDGSVNAAGLATNLRLRNADLGAFTKPATECAAEGIGALPASLAAGGGVQIISDCGDADFYNDGQAAKDLQYAAWKKFRGDTVAMAPLSSVALQQQAGDQTSAQLTATPSASGTLRAVVLPASAPAPSWEQVMAGQGATWASAVQDVQAGSAQPLAIAGLAVGVAYKLYAVSVSPEGWASALAQQAIAAPTPTGTSLLGSNGQSASVSGGGGEGGTGQWQFASNSSGYGALPTQSALPQGYRFPYGSLGFVLMGGAAGSTATVTLQLPEAAPARAVLWKFGATADQPSAHWYQLPAASYEFAANRRSVAFSIADGQLGDSDLQANGVIVDPVAVGLPEDRPLNPAAATPVPGLTGAMQAVLALLLLAGAAAWRRRS